MFYKSPYRFRNLNTSRKIVYDGLTKYYYEHSDLRLLLNLWAESHSLATSLKVLALFDPQFNKDLKVPDINFPNLPPKKAKRTGLKSICIDDGGVFEHQVVEIYNLDVSFDHAPANDGILAEIKKNIPFMYTVEIFPSTKKTSIIVVDVPLHLQKPSTQKYDDIEMENIRDNAGNVTLEELELSKEYTISINTVVDGKTLACKVKTFKWEGKV